MSEETVLPPAYGPFQAVLDLLATSLATLLRGQLLQFELLARDLEMQEFADQGEFEGLGGLTHHGTVDHILQSELLLRTEAPLEFLRRMAESETLYHDRIFADPGKQQVWRAIVSVGPGIMGHGRILALASLFFLARIAAQRGAEFHWCFLPRGEGAVWFEGLSVNAIKRFLRSASYREAGEDDVAAAKELWDTLMGARNDRRDRNFADWLIGSSPVFPASANELQSAIQSAPNALVFALHLPVKNELRLAEVTVRRRGRDARRTTITFADDRLCVSALEKPFPTPRAQATKFTAKGNAVPDMAGWEQRYISAPSPGYCLVRLSDGVLILQVHRGQVVEGGWFLPVAGDTILAGIAIAKDVLSVVRHEGSGHHQSLALRNFQLVPGKALSPFIRRQHSVPSHHLFKGCSPYALPTLSTGVTQFYSVPGLAFRFDFGPEESDTAVTALYGTARTLLASGAHRVVGMAKEGETLLTVLRRNQSSCGAFMIPGHSDLPKFFHGIAWSPSEPALAYSLRRGHWSVAPPRGANCDQDFDFRTEQCERVIGAGRGAQGLWARIWSDAAFGGEGTIELFNLEDGKRKRKLPPLRLGKHAADLGALIQTDDGYWAAVLGQNGEPAHLIHVGQHKDRRDMRAQSFAVGDLLAKASVLEWWDA